MDNSFFKRFSSSHEVSKQIFNDQRKEVPDYLQLSLMQKDKRILECNTKINESSSIISKLKQALDQKERDYLQLKAVIKDLSNEIELKDKAIRSSSNATDSIRDESQRENEVLKQKNKKLTNQINELLSKTAQCQLESEEQFNERNAIQIALSNKEREANEYKVTLRKYEEMLTALSKDNQQIAMMQLHLNESSDIIDKLTKQEQKNKEQIAFLLNENDALSNYLQSFSNEQQQAKIEYEHQLASFNAKSIDLAEQLKKKESDASTEKQKRKETAKELDQLLSFIINQLGLILTGIDNGAGENSLTQSSNGSECLNDSKYDLLKGNLTKINDKLNESHQKTAFQYKLFQKNLDGLSVENKELLAKIEAQRKAEAVDKNVIEELKKQMSKFEVFNDNYNGLKNKFLQLSLEHEALAAKNQQDGNKHCHFLQKLFDKLSKNNKEERVVSSESILKQVDMLNDNYNKLKIMIELKESEVVNARKLCEEAIKDNTEREAKLKEQMASTTAKAQSDIQKEKEISASQLSQLTTLLEESKSMLLKYHNDYDLLLEEKSKLEYRLQSIESFKEHIEDNS